MNILPFRRTREAIPATVWIASALAIAGFFALPDLLDPDVAAKTTGDIVGVASVIDGDTIEIHGTRIRLHAIDAPETRQTCSGSQGENWRCGVDASRALDSFVGRSTVTCEVKDIDRYGRTVARCRTRDEDLGAWMVRNGWAVAYLQYGSDYIRAEDAARAAGVGIWSGSFDMPWTWRRENS